ncbi:uncharacterized protein METZ01_LOCUS514106, partial [marine metagenome]
MKGFTSVSVLTAVLLLTLTGCGPESGDESKMTPATPKATLSKTLDGVAGIVD